MNNFSKIVAVILVLAGSILPALAQDYPSRVVRIVVGYPPGNFTDIAARLVADSLSEEFGQSFIVENKPGASGIIAVQTVKASDPDGYTLLVAPISTMVINPATYKSLPYDTLRDFAPVSLVGSTSMILLANKDFPARNVAALIDLLKKNPEQQIYAHQGVGSLTHLSMEMLKTLTGTEIRPIPYRGGGPAMTDLLAGRVPLMFDTIAAASGQVGDKAVLALGVWAKSRSAVLPDVPTLAESGVPQLATEEAVAWSGLFAPASTPPALVERLNAALSKNFQRSGTRTKFSRANIDMYPPASPAQVRTFVEREMEKWDRIAGAAGIKGSQSIGN